jgi:hypothetical protein
VPGTVLASVPMNVEGGSYLTFAFPIILFALVATVLWLLLFRPHHRVPPRRITAAAHAGSPVSGAAASGTIAASGTGSAEPAAESPGATESPGAAEVAGSDSLSGGAVQDTAGETEASE